MYNNKKCEKLIKNLARVHGTEFECDVNGLVLKGLQKNKKQKQKTKK